MKDLIQKTLNFINYLYKVENIELIEDKMCTRVLDLPHDYLE